MAGSNRGFPYVLPGGGDPLVVTGDESNIEAVNGAAATSGAAGGKMIRNDGSLRSATYRNPVTGATRNVVVLSEALLLALPLVIQFLQATGGSAGTAQPFNLIRTQGHKERLYAGDTGLTDGDAPN